MTIHSLTSLYTQTGRCCHPSPDPIPLADNTFPLQTPPHLHPTSTAAHPPASYSPALYSLSSYPPASAADGLVARPSRVCLVQLLDVNSSSRKAPGTTSACALRGMCLKKHLRAFSTFLWQSQRQAQTCIPVGEDQGLASMFW